MCDLPASVQNGHVMCETSANGIPLGQGCAYTCAEGYDMIGRNKTLCTIASNGDTAWNTNPPVCTRIPAEF